MRPAAFGLVAVGVLLLAAVALGVPRTVAPAVAAPVTWALLYVTAPTVVWGLAGGLTAGAAAFLVGSTASILVMFATQSAALGSDVASPAAAIALAAASHLGAPILGSYAGGAVMAHHAAGRTSLGRGFMAGALAEVARVLSSLGPSVLDAWPGRAAVMGALSVVLPLLLAATLVVGLAGAAGVWLGSSTGLGRRPALVGWSGSLVVFLVLAWVASSLLGPVLSGRTGLAPGVTVDGIRAVGVGMTRQEVDAILGPPMSSGPTPSREGGVTLTYSRPVPFARWYPTLPANMSETVTPLQFRVEGEQGSEANEHRGGGPRWVGDRGRGEGDAAPVHARVQAEDRPGGRRV